MLAEAVHLSPPIGASAEVARAYVAGLPPQEFWVQDPLPVLETPVDQRGIVNADELILAVKGLIHEDYAWMPPTDVHHLYWTRATYYKYAREHPGIASDTFRELAPHKIRVPRLFHNLVHAATLPPPIPDSEIIDMRVRAWQIAEGLFRSIREVTHSERLYRRRLGRMAHEASVVDDLAQLDPVGREIVNEMLLRHFRGVAQHLMALNDIPQEHWPFRPDVCAQVAAGDIGDMVLRGYMRRTKAVMVA